MGSDSAAPPSEELQDHESRAAQYAPTGGGAPPRNYPALNRREKGADVLWVTEEERDAAAAFLSLH
ncbi:hypothetical protein EYF80_040611 [Liparis tanakae]|uniref:Uncharacterized protein n=1 Tax=Liparis tanakae TaxID=230148 RepID=A0A4Z2G9K0_9TELE|nr:hypothetical protein EYF80_040611 [Liparis tanakae]